MDTSRLVYVVDDDTIIRRSLGLTVKAGGFLPHPFTSGTDLVESASYLKPGCVLLDVHMPGLSGLETQRYLAQHRTDLPVIMMSGQGDIPMAVGAIKNGAVDFIEKPFRDTLLLAMLEQVFARIDARSDLEQSARKARTRLDRLTAREHDVLGALLDGLPNKLVAQRLGLSVRTAEMHRANLLHKLEVRSVAEAMQVALTAGAWKTGGDKGVAAA